MYSNDFKPDALGSGTSHFITLGTNAKNRDKIANPLWHNKPSLFFCMAQLTFSFTFCTFQKSIHSYFETPDVLKQSNSLLSASRPA